MSKTPAPKPGILDIAPYVGGKSKVGGVNEPVKLSSNESPFPPSEYALTAYQKASEKLYRYPDGTAYDLREAIAEVQKLDINRLVCGAGSDELIGLLCHAYAGEGDEVLISEHGFLMYKIYAQTAGASVVYAPEKNLCADVDALLAKVTPRTKIVFLANPNNPTGSYLPDSEVECLVRAVPKHILVVLDAAYAEYVTEGDYDAGVKLVDAYPNVVMLRTFSKIYALPALRIGWGYMSAAIADVLNRVRGPFNLSSISIAAGAAAMRDTAYVERALAFNRTWLSWLSGELAALGLVVHPSVANFVLVEFPTSGKHTASAANAFLLERGLIVREVANYGLPNCLRVTIGLEEQNKAVVAALADFLKS